VDVDKFVGFLSKKFTKHCLLGKKNQFIGFPVSSTPFEILLWIKVYIKFLNFGGEWDNTVINLLITLTLHYGERSSLSSGNGTSSAL